MTKFLRHFILSITITIFLYSNTAFAAQLFPDMPSDHWAYDSVSELVNDGTISGFEDGTFQPNNIVSRAQFVKMIGKGPIKKDTNFNDVSIEHWGYDYIMYSGLKGDNNNNFAPEEPITRGQVAELVWQRAGGETGINAPSIITKQSKNTDAIAWIYQYGIMIGNDGIDLRLEDTLSRAEATTLIVRSRQINETSQQINFIDLVSPKLLENVYNSLRLFNDIPYNPDTNITNGEMTRAGVRLGSEEFSLTYRNYETSSPFEHTYVKDLFAMGKACLGEEKINEDFIDKQATVKDTLAILTYNSIKKSHTALRYGEIDDYYSDIASLDTKMLNICLTFAKQNGIQLYSNNNINSEQPITLKELSAILLQLDNLIGTQTSFTTDKNPGISSYSELNQKLQHDINKYPENFDKFQCVLADVPLDIYTVPLNSKINNIKFGNPKAVYDFTREYANIFIDGLQRYKMLLMKNSDVDVRFTYYPSLGWDNGNGYTLRVKCEIIDTPDNLLIKDVFKAINDEIHSTQMLHKGMAFYGDIVTGQPLETIFIPTDKIALEKIVCIVE